MPAKSHPSEPSQKVIDIHVLAPSKPAPGAPCNGCGLCCLAEPCPLGVLLSLRLQGPCRVLRWDPAATRYRCGALRPALNRGWRGAWARLRQHLLRRWIAAGVGCDCHLEALPWSTMASPNNTSPADDDHG